MTNYGIEFSGVQFEAPCFYLSTICDINFTNNVNQVYSLNGFFSRELGGYGRPFDTDWISNHPDFNAELGKNGIAYPKKTGVNTCLMFFKLNNYVNPYIGSGFSQRYDVNKNHIGLSTLGEFWSQDKTLNYKLYIYEPTISLNSKVNGYGLAIYNSEGEISYLNSADNDFHLIQDFRLGNIGGGRLYLAQTDGIINGTRKLHASDHNGNLIIANQINGGLVDGGVGNADLAPTPISIEPPTSKQEDWVKQQGRYIYFR